MEDPRRPGKILEAFRHLFFGDAPPGVEHVIASGPGSLLKAAIVDAPPEWFGIVLLAALPLVALTSMVFRYRRAGREQRQQIKWVVFGFVVALVSPDRVFGLVHLRSSRLSPTGPSAGLFKRR